jgi:hypothetical protein
MRKSTDGMMVSELLIIIAIVVALGLAFLQYQKTQKRRDREIGHELRTKPTA